MELTRQKFESHLRSDAKGNVQLVSERKVGPLERSEFGAPSDSITAAIGGGYIRQWAPDFLQKELEKLGVIARFYFDKKVGVDVAPPDDNISRRKRKLLFQNGFGYVCIPPNFPQELEPLRRLYQAAVNEYLAYEELHPRPVVLQDATIVDPESGKIRHAKIRAIDVKVGGGLIGSVEMQEADVRQAKPMGKQEIELSKERTRVMKAIREASEKGQPFRNPFIKPGKRLFTIEYSPTA